MTNQNVRHAGLVFTCILVVWLCAPDAALRAHDNHGNGADGHTDSTAPTFDTTQSTDSHPKTVSLGGPTVEAFQAFSKTVSVSVDGSTLNVESNGLPDHPMMIGIRSWQQQVPLPQPFVGDNAWRLPLKPRPAANPISVLRDALRGAIALAVNGIPIFCALNNRGEDTFLAGELDRWGGHCGRGDDYHYHTAPVHLEKAVGVGNPIGYALDGYPILGFADADGSIPTDLDEFNGHVNAQGHYHYHATPDFPYINGGLKGEVRLSGDQVVQPRDSPVRPGQPPLRGAVITGFTRTGNSFELTYRLQRQEARVKYSILDDGQYEFHYVRPSGESSTAVYRRGQTGPNRSMAAVVFVIAAMVAVAIAASRLRRRILRVGRQP